MPKKKESTKKEQIKANLKTDLWDLETVTAVVEAVKKEKNQKGVTMNMFTLKTDAENGDNEFKIFMDTLAANIHLIPDGTRIQLMVQSLEHWYPVDLQISGGNVSVIIPEAGFSSATANATVVIMNAFPNAEVYRFYPDIKTVDGKQRGVMIQADGESCSRFGLQQLFALQRLPSIHQQLQQEQGQLKTEDINPGAKNPYRHYKLSFKDTPPEIASIFRSTQSLSALAGLDQEMKDAVVNKKGETLEQYNQRFTRLNPETNRMQNMAIMDFKEKYADKTTAYLSKAKSEQLEGSLDFATRGGIDFLTKGAKYQDRYTEKQEARASSSVIKAKTARNDVCQQVNALCHEATDALNHYVTDPAAKALIDDLHAARINFMATRPDKSQSLKSAYKNQAADLNFVTQQVIDYLRQKPDDALAYSIQRLDTMSQALNSTIRPPERPNIIVATAMSFKEKLSSLVGKNKVEEAEDDDSESMHL
ncbi:YopJ family acetyltransferase [Legionella saoudiensis]|uniref:YopJ family acetyltransferase n=1 Tax=Legionella saoudiensis TaxID=1750561 RepID=UPI00073030A2|nr:hypothetical protein [Legionella saoudiensis]